jgi:hypothetical protein
LAASATAIAIHVANVTLDLKACLRAAWGKSIRPSGYDGEPSLNTVAH